VTDDAPDDKRHRVEHLVEALARQSKVRHRLQFSPAPEHLQAEDPIAKADRDVDEARHALRLLDELHQRGSRAELSERRAQLVGALPVGW
jgi:hypothetical protein